uniref:Uncharacterized protein n=1 Tax=Setaria italica TaxID=4555 RepID=K3YBC0_SETIT
MCTWVQQPEAEAHSSSIECKRRIAKHNNANLIMVAREPKTRARDCWNGMLRKLELHAQCRSIHETKILCVANNQNM